MPDVVIIVEDSHVLAKSMANMIKNSLNVLIETKSNYKEAKDAVENFPSDYNLVAAILDLNLPDAPDGEVVDLYLEHKVPSIVLTGSFDESSRTKLIGRGVVDYILKESKQSIEYVLRVIHRLMSNKGCTAMVVDDSKMSRKYVRNMLEQQNYQVAEACDGLEALEILEQQDISLILTDYVMPNMDGVELLKKIRTKRDSIELPVIALSSQENDAISARFLKNGANDFLKKPFSYEEFQSRTMAVMEALDNIRLIQDQANKDYLTKLYNRRYFYEQGDMLYQDNKASGKNAYMIMLDIDHFKSINDTHGHDIGDKALKTISSVLSKVFRDELVARLGGEEFVAFASGMTESNLQKLIKLFVHMLKQSPVQLDDGSSFTMTVSIGVTNQYSESLEAMLHQADELLYQAKENGRDQVCSDFAD